MSNYNVRISLEKIEGAKVMEIEGKTMKRLCICIPIDNERGTVTNGYVTSMGERRETDVMLNLTALSMREEKYGKSHILKEAVSKEVFEHLSEEAQRNMPIVGNLSPWRAPAAKKDDDLPPDNAGSDW